MTEQNFFELSMFLQGIWFYFKNRILDVRADIETAPPFFPTYYKCFLCCDIHLHLSDCFLSKHIDRQNLEYSDSFLFTMNRKCLRAQIKQEAT